MRINIKKKLQIRFVLLSVIALIILQSLIVSVSIARSYKQITLKADNVIMLTSSSPDSSDVADARYFTVDYTPGKKGIKTDLTHTKLVSRPLAIDYAKKVIDKKSDKGYIDNYRYLVRREKGNIHITFLSRAATLDSFKSNAKTLILISVAGIVIMTVILSLVSGKVVEPIVRNRQKQKEFITSASHELKTPLTVINADSQLLETEIGENEWLTDIVRQTKYMTEMTNRLVYLARAEEQGENFKKIEFPISDVAEDIADSYRSVAKSSGKEYSVSIEKGISYCGDENAVREMMNALTDNAFKYSTPGGSIAVKLFSKGSGIVFAVENTVHDIKSLKLANFTDRFYRNSNSNNVKGFGIGLSVAKAVAEAHKGKLNIETKENDTIIISANLK